MMSFTDLLVGFWLACGGGRRFLLTLGWLLTLGVMKVEVNRWFLISLLGMWNTKLYAFFC